MPCLGRVPAQGGIFKILEAAFNKNNFHHQNAFIRISLVAF